jgi:hypothetical protein
MCCFNLPLLDGGSDTNLLADRWLVFETNTPSCYISDEASTHTAPTRQGGSILGPYPSGKVVSRKFASACLIYISAAHASGRRTGPCPPSIISELILGCSIKGDQPVLLLLSNPSVDNCIQEAPYLTGYSPEVSLGITCDDESKAEEERQER